jgi:integrase/recombinase XerD
VNGAPLFCTLDGQSLYSVYVRQMIARMARRANIEKRVTPHTLRHTFAVDLERSGMPVTAISKLLGHSSVSVTSRYLDHLTNSEAVTQFTRTELPAL